MSKTTSTNPHRFVIGVNPRFARNPARKAWQKHYFVLCHTNRQGIFAPVPPTKQPTTSWSNITIIIYFSFCSIESSSVRDRGKSPELIDCFIHSFFDRILRPTLASVLWPKRAPIQIPEETAFAFRQNSPNPRLVLTASDATLPPNHDTI